MKNSQDDRHTCSSDKSARAAAISNLLFFLRPSQGTFNLLRREQRRRRKNSSALAFIGDSKAKARWAKQNKSREMSIRAEDEPQQFIISPQCAVPVHAPRCALFYNFACTPNKQQMIVRFITFACQTAGLKIGKWTARGVSGMPTFFADGTNFHFASLTHSHSHDD